MRSQTAGARAQRVKLSPARIIEQALVVIDEGGLGQFSMRALAARLGVDPMSIYHHLPSKSAILDGVVDALVEKADLPRGGSITWQDWVRTASERWVGLAVAHPDAFLIFGERNLSSTESFKPMEALADALIRGGFEPSETWEIVLLFSNYATAVGLAVARAGQSTRVNEKSRGQPSLSPSELPRLAAVASETTASAVFRRGLEAMITGFEVELRRRRRGRRR